MKRRFIALVSSCLLVAPLVPFQARAAARPFICFTVPQATIPSDVTYSLIIGTDAEGQPITEICVDTSPTIGACDDTFETPISLVGGDYDYGTRSIEWFYQSSVTTATAMGGELAFYVHRWWQNSRLRTWDNGTWRPVRHWYHGSKTNWTFDDDDLWHLFVEVTGGGVIVQTNFKCRPY